MKVEWSVPDGLPQRVYKFTQDLFTSHRGAFTNDDSATVPFPTPNAKACTEFSTREGGCLADLYNKFCQAHTSSFNIEDPVPHSPYIREDVEDVHDNRMWMHLWKIKETPVDLEMSDLDAFKTARFYTNRLKKSAADLSIIPLLPDDIRQPWAKPVAIEELGQKVRIATMHPGTLAYFSRAMAARLLPVLKRMRVTRRILHGDTIHLRGFCRAKIYSADLSAASDFIRHDIGQKVLEGIADGLNIQGPTREALLRCIGPMVVPVNNKPEWTRMGAHMGLGTTWTVLSVLNYFAASKAGDDRSFAICGDDLVAAWTPEQVLVYENMIESLGLKLNKTKSYYGESGVFCEQAVTSTGGNDFWRYYRSRPQPVLSEITCARGTPDGTTRESLKALLTTSLLRIVRKGIDQTLRNTRKGMIEGPVCLGGFGGETSNEKAPYLLSAFLQFGPVRYNPEKNEDMRNLNANILSYGLTVPIKNCIPTDKAIISAKCLRDMKEIRTGKTTEVFDKASNNKVRRLCRKRLQQGEALLQEAHVRNTTSDWKALVKYLLSAVRSTTFLSRRFKDKCHSILKRANKHTYNRAIAYITRNVSQNASSTFIPISNFNYLLQFDQLNIKGHLQDGTEKPSWWERTATRK